MKPGKKEGGLKQPDDDSLDPRQFYERRVKAIKAARDADVEPYPHKFHTSLEVPAYIAKYKHIQDGEHLEGETESIAGRSFIQLMAEGLPVAVRLCFHIFGVVESLLDMHLSIATKAVAI